MPDDTAPAPSVGRIVHYFGHRSEQPTAAIVTAVIPAVASEERALVCLTLFPVGAPPFTLDNVPHVDAFLTGEPAQRYWAWPERV